MRIYSEKTHSGTAAGEGCRGGMELLLEDGRADSSEDEGAPILHATEQGFVDADLIRNNFWLEEAVIRNHIDSDSV